MKTKILLVMAAITIPLIFTSCSEIPKPYELNEYHMGTIITAKVYGEKAEKAAREGMDKIASIEKAMTKNEDGSEIDKLNDNEGANWVKLDDETLFVIKTGIKFSELSGGAFDLTIGPLVKAWGIHTEAPRIPGADEIKRLMDLINYKDILIDESGSRARLARKGQGIDLGGIAKGYAADKVVEIYRKYGIKSAYINLGGNIKVLGEKPDGSTWKIGIQNPRAPNGKIVGIVEVKDKTVVSSGDYERYFVENGKRYHHILDPHTGYPAESGLIGISIIADRSIDADALSTSAFILGLEKGRKMIEGLKGIDAVFITADRKVYITSGLKGVFTFDDESREYEYVEEG